MVTVFTSFPLNKNSNSTQSHWPKFDLSFCTMTNFGSLLQYCSAMLSPIYYMAYRAKLSCVISLRLLSFFEVKTPFVD